MTLSVKAATAATASLALGGLFAAVAFWPTSTAAAGPTKPVAPDSAEFYTREVQPIFRSNCYRCHGGMNHRGSLHLDSPAGILQGGKNGAILVPGHPDQSLLITLIRHEGPAADPRPMPPRGQLSAADIATITAWIQAGAILPAATASSKK